MILKFEFFLFIYINLDYYLAPASHLPSFLLSSIVSPKRTMRYNLSISVVIEVVHPSLR